MSRRKQREQSGFTVLEVLVAILVLTIGLVGTAAMGKSTVNSTAESHLMSTAALLASEKLEDLGRYSAGDVPVQAGGSLVADTSGYFDNVQISVDNGAINETTLTNGVSTSNNIAAAVDWHDGDAGRGAAAVTSDTLTFNRRWLITYNTPVTGVQTVTVLVTATTQALKPQELTFQMTMVRP